jgi:hypothetical protein
MPPAHCEGVDVQSSGVLDLDVPLVRITGHITIDGRPLDSEESRALRISLEHHTSGTNAVLRAPSLRTDGTYELLLPRGLYDIHLATLDSCEAHPSLPCVGAPLRSDMRIDQDGTLDFDLPTARVEIEVTANSSPLTSGHLEISNEGAHAAVPIRNGNVAVRVVRGSYSIAYSNPDCTGPAPCGHHELGTPINAQSDGFAELPVPVVHVTGAVAIDGMSSSQDLDVWFRRDTWQGSVRASRAHFSAYIVPSTYDVGIAAIDEPCRLGGTLPCVPALIRSSVAFTQNGALDLDVRTIAVSGEVRVNGAPTSGGQLRIQGASGDGVGSAISWGARLVPGEYAFFLEGGSCDGSSYPLPCNGGVLARRTLIQSGALDLDVRTVRITGRSLATAASSSLHFVSDGDASAARVPIGGDGQYAVTLIAGTYAIDWSSREAGCDSLAASDCLEIRVLARAALETDGALDVMPSVFALQGTVRLNGTEPAAPARLTFVTTDALGRAYVALDSSSAFALPFTEGRWVIEYEPDAALCMRGLCGNALIAGCEH